MPPTHDLKETIGARRAAGLITGSTRYRIRCGMFRGLKQRCRRPAGKFKEGFKPAPGRRHPDESVPFIAPAKSSARTRESPCCYDCAQLPFNRLRVRPIATNAVPIMTIVAGSGAPVSSPAASGLRSTRYVPDSPP